MGFEKAQKVFQTYSNRKSAEQEDVKVVERTQILAFDLTTFSSTSVACNSIRFPSTDGILIVIGGTSDIVTTLANGGHLLGERLSVTSVGIAHAFRLLHDPSTYRHVASYTIVPFIRRRPRAYQCLTQHRNVSNPTPSGILMSLKDPSRSLGCRES